MTRDYIIYLVKGVAMKNRKLFSEIETSNEPVRASNYVRYVCLQHYENGMQKFNYSCLQKVTPMLIRSSI